MHAHLLVLNVYSPRMASRARTRARLNQNPSSPIEATTNLLSDELPNSSLGYFQPAKARLVLSNRCKERNHLIHYKQIKKLFESSIFLGTP